MATCFSLIHTESIMLLRLTLCAIAALLWSAPAQDLSSKLTEKIEAALKKSGAPSVSVAVVQDGKIAFAKAFGNADLETGRPADMNTRYAVGSISKQFTAAALLLLQEQGKLSLDDKVSKYFPNLTRAGEITIRQLLSHTSGYEDYAPQDYIIPDWTRPITPAAILDRWANKPLNFDPGTKWQYSNTNYVLAGEIFEKVSGRQTGGLSHHQDLRAARHALRRRLASRKSGRRPGVYALRHRAAAARETGGIGLVFRGRRVVYDALGCRALGPRHPAEEDPLGAILRRVHPRDASCQRRLHALRAGADVGRPQRNPHPAARR